MSLDEPGVYYRMDVKVILDDFINEQVSSNEDFTKDFGFQGVEPQSPIP